MSKVTIKFWDKKTGAYAASQIGWILDQGLDCYKWNGEKIQYEYDASVEPHFYQDGERIA